ncbi:MAG: DinB family protein [Candidatus Acidiferrales bacterium]
MDGPISHYQRAERHLLQHVVWAYGVNLYVAKSLVADLTADQMCQQPHGVVNHPAWSLGHLVFSSVGLLRFLGHDASPPVGWEEAAFAGAGGIPSSDPSGFPSKDELLSTLESLHDRVTTAVKAADAATLAATLATPHPYEGARKYFPTLGDHIVYLMTLHEMDHLGQLAAWRRAMGLGPAKIETRT